MLGSWVKLGFFLCGYMLTITHIECDIHTCREIAAVVDGVLVGSHVHKGGKSEIMWGVFESGTAGNSRVCTFKLDMYTAIIEAVEVGA